MDRRKAINDRRETDKMVGCVECSVCFGICNFWGEHIGGTCMEGTKISHHSNILFVDLMASPKKKIRSRRLLPLIYNVVGG